jgi:hypothetical protein
MGQLLWEGGGVGRGGEKTVVCEDEIEGGPSR